MRVGLNIFGALDFAAAVPESRGRELEDDLGEDEEGESGPALDDVLDLDALLVRHEAEDGEDHGRRVERRERVHGAHHEGVPVGRRREVSDKGAMRWL